jgi:hypothetical protein
MKRTTISARALWLAVIIAAISVFAVSAFGPAAVSPAAVPAAGAPAAFGPGSACAFPACNQKGERYDAASGDCQSGPDPITRALSHRIPSCLSDERFDRATGQCVLNACSDDGCEARVLCTGRSHYSRSGRDSTGVYGVCESVSGLGYRSHELVRCPRGFTLNEARGVCVGNCAPAPKASLPDLIIRSVYLRTVAGGPAVTGIRLGQRYWACFKVANVGASASGPFQVGGGGLGVRTAPSQAHATLLPGATREGCLLYPTTPPIGSYRLGIEADSRRVVRETREDNNTATLVVNVVP